MRIKESFKKLFTLPLYFKSESGHEFQSLSAFTQKDPPPYLYFFKWGQRKLRIDVFYH